MKEDEKLNKDELLKLAMENLEDSKFAFACFVDNFKRYIERKNG